MAKTDGLFEPPLAGQVSSGAPRTVGGITYLPYSWNVANDCTMVEPGGPVSRQGAELTQVLKERADPGCRGKSRNASGTLVLGALPPGDYQFHFTADGQVIHTAAVNVPSDTGRLLTVSRTDGHELQLQINGVGSVVCTIQASPDLRSWFDIPAHAGPFLGPYSIYQPLSAAPARYYRVRPGP